MLKHEVAKIESIWTIISRLRNRDIDALAPLMRTAVQATQHECEGIVIQVWGGPIPLDMRVFETLRPNELQAIYYSQGTSKAKDVWGSWHGYGLAIDFISKQYEWFNNQAAKARWPNPKDRNNASYAWFDAVADIAKRNGLKWGGDWKYVDLPHLYWGKCAASPSQISRDIVAKTGKIESVWKLVGAA